MAAKNIIRACCVMLLLGLGGHMNAVQGDERKKQVVLLHGLARSHRSMAKMELALQARGYQTLNIGYPSTRHTIDILVDQYVMPQIDRCFGESETPVHFVTHSMGGILVRAMAEKKPAFTIGNVVMLSPPNKGSEVVDVLGEQWFFRWMNGPAGQELGTGEGSKPNTLGPATFDLGIITGDRSINLILSTMIHGPNDGKVSVANAKLEGMQDFLVLHVSHPFIMRNDTVIRHTIRFLDHGVFYKPS